MPLITVRSHPFILPDHFPSEVYVSKLNLPGGYCTGTMLTNEWILTARHCLTNFTQNNGLMATVGYVSIADDYSLSHPLDERTGIYDVALVKLIVPMFLDGPGYNLTVFDGLDSELVGKTLQCIGWSDAEDSPNSYPLIVDAVSDDGLGLLLKPNDQGQLSKAGDSGRTCFLSS